MKRIIYTVLENSCDPNIRALNTYVNDVNIVKRTDKVNILQFQEYVQAEANFGTLVR